MKLSKSAWSGALICGAFLLMFMHAEGAMFRPKSKVKPKSNPPSQVSIRRDHATGKVVISWKGRGALKKAGSRNGRLTTVYRGTGDYIAETTGDAGFFTLEGEAGADGPTNVYSRNVVGYVNLHLPPGLSLIANPLYQSDSSLGSIVVTNWWCAPPDGCQVFKFSADSPYEVSTFDGVSGTWSNPNLDVSVGTGFYFNNPSSITVTQTFVGEVGQGVLINPLPAGMSTKGALVPQEGSINDVHGIPGDPGDEIRTYVNDQMGGGYYNVSVFNGDTQRWEPDLILHVAEGFWINKQRAEDWIRIFWVQ